MAENIAVGGPAHPGLGFWQVLADPSLEEVFEFRGTTTTERPGHGFVLYTREHFVEVRTTAPRRPPVDHPPSQPELRSMFDVWEAAVGTHTWEPTDRGWRVHHHPITATNPPSTGDGVRTVRAIDNDVATVDQGDQAETWRRLSGRGQTPLSGVWVAGEETDRWIYLTTAGHYGIVHADLTAPVDTSTLSINMGARVETGLSFDHWPMAGPVFGYDTRKHESFRIESLEPDRFSATIPTFGFPAAEWTRLE